MKLSEAIRLGSMMKPQGFGTPFDWIPERTQRRCAVEAAGDAIGVSYHEAEQRFYLLNEDVPSGRCPVCDKEGLVIGNLIAAHLNDLHRWTREEIADWVETIERQHETAQIVNATEELHGTVDQPEAVAVR